MLLYKVEWDDVHAGRMLSWHPSSAEARKERKRIRREETGGDFEVIKAEIYMVDVPTHKAGLVAWLNNTLNVDNG